MINISEYIIFFHIVEIQYDGPLNPELIFPQISDFISDTLLDYNQCNAGTKKFAHSKSQCLFQLYRIFS